MTKRAIALVIVMFATIQTGIGCDVCGGVSGIGTGLISAYKSNFLQFAYQSTSIHASTRQDIKVKDNYHLGTINLRYGIHKKVNLWFSAPYSKKTRDYNNEMKTSEGIGDPEVLVFYTVFKDAKIQNNMNLFMEIGTGINSKAGKYDNSIINEDLPKGFNPGNGSIDIPLRLRMVFTNGTYGMIINGRYSFNGETHTGHQFGNPMTISSLLYKEAKVNSNTIFIPSTGFVYDHKALDQFPNEKKELNTGGDALFVSINANIKKDKWLYGISGNVPLYQNYAENNLKVKRQLSCQISYLF